MVLSPVKPNRYLKLASAKNPTDDFIELNNFGGFLCTSFQSLGISRILDFLTAQNRQFAVNNKPAFKKYSLTIEILTKYSEYEQKYRELITFLDRNKKSGFRLYFRPYEGMDLRYCLCDIETSVKTDKLQPVVLTLQQESLWFGEEQVKTTTPVSKTQENLFSFADDGEGYYSAKFALDKTVSNYYCIAFFNDAFAEVEIENKAYNDIPLKIKVYGYCVTPTIKLFEKGNNNPIRVVQVNATINKGWYLEINSDILENGVWYVNKETGERIDYTSLVNNELGSPYIYLDNGKYMISVTDNGNNVCLADILFQEEYSE